VASVPNFAQFQAALRGTPMAREAKGIYNAALKGGINPAFVAGLASAESNYGRAGYAVGRNNPFGLGVSLNWKFPSYAAATTKLAQQLGSKSGLNYDRLFKKRGLAGIISQYSPKSDGNNEAKHARNIVIAGRKTGGDASQVYVGGGAGGGGGAAPAPQAPAGTQAPGPSRRLSALMNQQYQQMASGNYDPATGQAASMEIAKYSGQRMRSMEAGPGGMGGGQAASPTDATASAGGSLPMIPRSANQPRLSKWGGPEDHGKRALGDWQSDMAYDLGGPTGTLVTSPGEGRVTRVSGQPGGDPGFAGYGVTVDYGGGKQAFFKHLGTKGQDIRVGQRVKRGTVIGGLDARTAGGPHLHLGASNRSFLDQVQSYYTG